MQKLRAEACLECSRTSEEAEAKERVIEDAIVDEWQEPCRTLQGLWILLQVTLGATDGFQAWEGMNRLPFGNSYNGNSG